MHFWGGGADADCGCGFELLNYVTIIIILCFIKVIILNGFGARILRLFIMCILCNYVHMATCKHKAQ